MLATKNPYLDHAYKQLQVISQDKEKRLEYEAREKAIRDYNQLMYEAEQRGIETGEKIGEQNKAVQIAKNLISLNIPIETILLSTGLSKEQIQTLQKNQETKP